MILRGLQGFARTGHGFNDVRAITDSQFHLLDVTLLQFILLRTDVFTRDAFAAQRLLDDLQIGHTRHHHLAQRTRSAENRFEHRNRVVLENAVTLSADERAIKIPEEYPDI